MKRRLLENFKWLLTVLGSKTPEAKLHQFQMVVNYMKLGRWMSRHNFHFDHRARDREALFASVAEKVRDRRVLYLEFGVYRGASMRYWSHALKHSEAKLHGFDSFEGLPEDFDVNGPMPKGMFSTGGTVPVIEDTRVQFFKGWFDRVLPSYSVPEHDVLVITLDADLYSSTIFVLRHLRPWIRPGTYLYFDDLSRPEHEPRAFDEFMKETGLKFSPLYAESSLNRAVFQCTA